MLRGHGIPNVFTNLTPDVPSMPLRCFAHALSTPMQPYAICRVGLARRRHQIENLPHAAIHEGRQSSDVMRRSLLQGVCAFAACSCTPGLVKGSQIRQVEGEDTAQQFWTRLVVEAKSKLGDDFDAKLTFYTPSALLPSGIPGDPAFDYKSKRSGACGAFQSGQARPYAMCPDPGGEPADLLTRECCRHFAYCVPRSRYGWAVPDRVTTVVASPRMMALAPSVWQAMLVHEMGHCVDFHVFGGQYGLTDHSPVDGDAAAVLSVLDVREEDPELRADCMGEAICKGAVAGRRLCYSRSTTLQVLLPPDQFCSEDDSNSSAGAVSGQYSSPYMLHFTHPPPQGSFTPARRK